MKRFLLLAVVLACTTTSAWAEVVRLEISERTPYADGKKFGDVGAYESLRGKVTFAFDPAHAANANIVDLDLAPRNAQGRVECWADVLILTPVDRRKANGAVLYDVNNRGNPTATSVFNGGGDDFLMRQGYTIVWSGWTAEALPGDDRIVFDAPLALQDGKPLTGVVRAEFILPAAAQMGSLPHRGVQGSYRPLAAAEQEARLTMRVNESDPRVEIPRDQWQFVVLEIEHQGRPWKMPKVDIAVKNGLKSGLIYEVVYTAEGSLVHGAGMAGIRDLVSLLKYDRTERNPLRHDDGSPLVTRAHGFGTSQSGRLLRQFLYDGFNADEQGRKILDGVMPHVAGGSLGSFNHRFASPTRTCGQHEEHLFPADVFPFTYGESVDPQTGRREGILSRAAATNTLPKVMHTQSSSEYWHRSGSLVHTDPLGKTDADVPANVRIYAFGGTQHGAGSGLPGKLGAGQLPANPSDYRPLMRALLTALDAWVVEGREPPPSAYPKIADGTAVDWRESSSGWRAIPGVAYPTVVQQPPMLDRGPDWFTKRIATIEPPRIVGSYIVRVPAYGPDNNERGTLNLPSVAVPTATYTSWNLRSEAAGAPGELIGLTGGYTPFAKTKADREAANDPRPAILERFRDFEDYKKQFMAEVDRLIGARYLLPEDRARQESLCEKFRERF